MNTIKNIFMPNANPSKLDGKPAPKKEETPNSKRTKARNTLSAKVEKKEDSKKIIGNQIPEKVDITGKDKSETFFECCDKLDDTHTFKSIKDSSVIDDSDELFYDCKNTTIDPANNLDYDDDSEEYSHICLMESFIDDIHSSYSDPASYLANNPNFLLDAFDKNNNEAVDDIHSRIIALDDEISHWARTPDLAKIKINNLHDLIDKYRDESDGNGVESKDNRAIFNELIKELRIFEVTYKITPYEDICKAALLINSDTELRKFFNDDSLEKELKDLTHPENYEIHKTSGKSLASCLDRIVKKHCLSLKKKATDELASALNNTSFSTNQGDITSEQLYARVMSLKEGPTLIRDWLKKSIIGNWMNINDNSAINSLSMEDKNILLSEVGFYGRTDDELESWLNTSKNIDILKCLNETLLLTHAHNMVKDIQEKHQLPKVSESPSPYTSQMAWCQNIKKLLDKFKSELSTKMSHDISKLLSVIKRRTIEDVINTGCISDDPIYHLPKSLSIENASKFPHLKKNFEAVSKHLHDLIEMKNNPLKDVSIQEEAKLKYSLLTSQMDLLLHHAESLIGKKSSLDSDDFNIIYNKIKEIDSLRECLVDLQNTNKTALEKAISIGTTALQGKDISVDNKLQNLKLRHQLKLDGYNYNDEKKWIYDNLYSSAGELATIGKDACKRFSNDKKNPVKLLWDILNFKDGTCQQVQETLNKAFFTDFKELMKLNPKLARNMWGDIAQSSAIVMHIFGESSAIYRLFDQLNCRAFGETAQTYVNDRFHSGVSNYDDLTEKQKVSMKRMFALCEMLKEAPTTLQVVKTGGNVVKNILLGNFGNAAYDGAKGAFELWGVQKIQDNISALSNDEVRTLHMASSALQQTPAETMYSLDRLQKSADGLADSIEGRSVLSNCLRHSELMRPFVFRLNKLNAAFHEYWYGNGSGKQLCWELGKVGLISGGAIGALGLSALTASSIGMGLGAASLSWHTMGLVVGYSVPTLLLSVASDKPMGCLFLSTAHSIANKLLQMENLESPAVVVKDLISIMRKDPDSELKQLEIKLRTAVDKAFQNDTNRMREHNGIAIARHTCIDTYKNYWVDFSFKEPGKSVEVIAMVDKLQRSDNENFKKQSETLQHKVKSWQLLSSYINKMPSDTSTWIESVKGLELEPGIMKSLGNNRQQLPYKIIYVLEMLQEEITKEMGVELNWKKQTALDIQNHEDIVLNKQNVVNRLRDYQGRIILGNYLAGNFSPAYKRLPEVKQKSEHYVLECSRKRVAEQTASLANFLLRLSISHLAYTQVDKTGKVDKDKLIESLRINNQLKISLAQQLTLMKNAARGCIKDHITGLQDSLEKMGIETNKKQLKSYSFQSQEEPDLNDNECNDSKKNLAPDIAHLRNSIKFIT